MLTNPWAQKLIGVGCAVGCYVIAATLMKGSEYAKEVAMAGTFIMGWLVMGRPGDQKVEPVVK